MLYGSEMASTLLMERVLRAAIEYCRRAALACIPPLFHNISASTDDTSKNPNKVTNYQLEGFYRWLTLAKSFKILQLGS